MNRAANPRKSAENYTKKRGAGVYSVEAVRMNASNSEESNWCERLYDEKAAALLLYGRALGLSHAEAEDVLQETFVALLALPEAPSQPEHYLVRAFRNRTLNYRRGFWRRVAREFEAKHWFEPAEARSELEERAVECLRQLPPEQREVLVLKVWHEMTFDAIATLLELSPNTVAGRYRYGLQKLRACFSATSAEPHERHEHLGDPSAWMATAPTQR